MTQTIPFEDIVLQKIDNRGKTPPVFSAGYPLLEVNSLSRNRLYPDISKVSKWVNGETYASWFRQYLEKDDILFSTVGTIAESAIIPAEPIYAVAQNILGFRFKSEIIDPKYALYLMRSSWFINQITGRTIETVQKSIKWSDMRGIKINLPDLDTQEKIAAILWSLDEKIELNRQMNETLEQMGQALFRHYFIDNPEAEKWEKVQLGDYLKVVRGLSYKGSFLSDDDSDNPMINLGSFAVDGTYNGGNIKYYNGEYKERATVLSGDLILANTDMTQERVVLGSVLRVPDLSGTILFTHHVYGLRELQLPKEYLYYLLKRPQFRERAQGFATGTTVLFMPAEAITKLSFKLPGTKTMNDFVHVATDISDIKELVRTQIQTLTTLRDTLLPRLIDGKVKV